MVETVSHTSVKPCQNNSVQIRDNWFIPLGKFELNDKEYRIYNDIIPVHKNTAVPANSIKDDDFLSNKFKVPVFEILLQCSMFFYSFNWLCHQLSDQCACPVINTVFSTWLTVTQNWTPPLRVSPPSWQCTDSPSLGRLATFRPLGRETGPSGLTWTWTINPHNDI